MSMQSPSSSIGIARNLDWDSIRSPGTVNLRLAAIRRLAFEAADSGLLNPEQTAGIRRVKGAKKLGVRLANWLLANEASALWELPGPLLCAPKPRCRSANWSRSNFCLDMSRFRRQRNIMRSGWLCRVASVSACQSDRRLRTPTAHIYFLHIIPALCARRVVRERSETPLKG